MTGDRVCHVGRGLRQSVVWHHAIDEAQCQRLLCVEAIAKVEQFKGTTQADDAGQHVNAAQARGGAPLHVRQAEFGAGGRDAQVAQRGQYATTADRRAVYLRDQGLFQCAHCMRDRTLNGQPGGAILRLGTAPRHVVDVAPGAENPPRAAHHHHPGRAIGLRVAERGGHAGQEAVVHGVEHVRAIERDVTDHPLALVDHRCWHVQPTPRYALRTCSLAATSAVGPAATTRPCSITYT